MPIKKRYRDPTPKELMEKQWASPVICDPWYKARWMIHHGELVVYDKRTLAVETRLAFHSTKRI